MSAAHYLTILSVWLVGVVSPGPDALLVTRETLRGGRARGIEAALGIATGIGVWVLVASLAGAALADRDSAALAALELAGGLYLAYLGVLSLRAEHAPPMETGHEPLPGSRRPSGSFAAGLITNLLNPKALLFFAAIFTALVPATAGTADRVALGIIFVVSEAAWFCGVAVLVGGAARRPSAHRWRRRIDLVAGALFLTLGTVAIIRGVEGLSS